MARNATASEKRKIAAGGRRLPGGVLSKQAAQHLETLRQCNYGDSLLHVIERALKEAVDNNGL